MSRTSALLLLALATSVAASAQRAPQFDLAVGASVVDGDLSPAVTATLTAWPSRVGFVVHGEYANQAKLLETTQRTAAAVGVLAALAVPLSEGEITFAAGPSLSYEDIRFENAETGRGWTPGATGRMQVAFPVGRTVGLALGVSGTASADGFRPVSTMGLALRLGN